MSRLSRSVLLGLLSVPALAAGQPSLDPVLVSAARTPVRELNTAASITVIDRAQLEASGAQTVADALRGAAGVQLRDLYGNGQRPTVSLRGFGENAAANTLVLVDGRRLNNPDQHEPELSMISLKDVERIEVVQGGAGVLYGDQAVGGVINIITRGVSGFAADAELSAGSYRQRGARLSVQNRLAGGLNFRLSAEAREGDHYRDNNDEDYLNLFGRLGYDYASGSVFAEYQFVDEELELPGALFADQLAVGRRRSVKPGDFEDSRAHVARLGLRQGLGEHWQFEGELTRRDSEIKASFEGHVLDQEREQTSVTPRLIGSYPLRHGELLFTVGADLDDADYRIVSPFGRTSATQEVRSLYAQAVAPLGAALTATVGVRRTEADYDIVDVSIFGPGLDDRFEEDATVGELGLSWALSPALRWFGRVGEVFRFAKIDELTQAANPARGLEPQTGESYETGLEWRGTRAGAKLVLYRLDLEDEIAFDPITFTNSNFDPTRRDGLIVEADWQALPSLWLAARYGYVDASFEDGPFAGNEVPGVSRHTGQLSALWRLDPQWSLYSELIFSGRAYAIGDLANEFPRRGSYAVVNLNLGYERGPWRATLRVNNLFDREYVDVTALGFNGPIREVGYYPAPERNLLLSLRRTF